MNINFNQIIKDIYGGEVKDLTLQKVSVDALLATFEDERILSGEEKAKRWLIATRIVANPEDIDLETQDIALIKKLIGKGYSPLIVGRAWEMLEGK